MILAEFLSAAIDRLKAAGIDNPGLDARLLFGYALGLDRAQLLSQSQRILTDDEAAILDALIVRRGKYEPVARIIGKREFWDLQFGLNEATLEPRPDSEILIEAVLSSFRRKPESSGERPRVKESSAAAAATLDSGFRRNDEIKILDLGTGTGCLLLSLLHEWKDATGVGIDIAPRAVEQATQNAVALRLNNRATFRVGNWLEGITDKFDVIISNPPYIAADVIPVLMPEVRNHDPIHALDGGEDGLTAYRFLIPQLKDFLNPQGVMAFEVGIGQARQIADLFRQGGFTNIEIHKDLGGIERCVSGSRLSPG